MTTNRESKFAGLSRALATALILTLAGLSPSARAAADKPSAALIAVLNSNASQKEKADACRELARVGGKESVAALARLLPDEQMSHMARYALETIPDSSVDKAFRAALENLKGRPLVGVIGSVGVRRDAKAVSRLNTLLRGSDPEAAEAAARALGSIGTSSAAKALERALPAVAGSLRLAICEGLLRCAEKRLAAGDNKRAVAIYDQLRKAPGAHQVRTAAVRGAILARTKDQMKLFTETLLSADYLTFSAAVRASAELKSPETVRVLAGELREAPADRRLLLIQALADRGDPAALPALSAEAQAGPAETRVAALRGIGELGKPAGVPVLRDLVKDQDPKVAKAAQEALAGLPGKEADDAVLAMLTGTDPAVRIAAMDLISRRRMTSAIPALFKAAETREGEERIVAIHKLGEIGGAAEFEPMLKLLMETQTPESGEAAEEAVTAIATRAVPPGTCAARAGALLAGAEASKKCALIRLLSAAGGPEALSAVRGTVGDTNAEVRAAAIRALANWSTPDAAPALLELARTTEGAERLVCLRGYLGFAGQADLGDAKRLAMAKEAASLVQKEDEKKLLLGTLGGIYSREAFNLASPYLEDAALRHEAGLAVVGIAEKVLAGAGAAQFGKDFRKPLETITGDSANADLAGRAQALLKRIGP